MPAIQTMVRNWSDDVALAVTRLDEAGSALHELAERPALAREATEAVRDGASFDDPFDAALALAQVGNRGLYDGFSKAAASVSLLDRALRAHPGGSGATRLGAARELADQASGDLGNWIANGGRHGDAGAMAELVQPRIERARSLAAAALAG